MYFFPDVFDAESKGVSTAPNPNRPHTRTAVRQQLAAALEEKYDLDHISGISYTLAVNLKWEAHSNSAITSLALL